MKNLLKTSVFVLGLLIMSCQKSNTQLDQTKEKQEAELDQIDWSKIDFNFEIDFETKLDLNKVNLEELYQELATEIYEHDFKESNYQENPNLIGFKIEFTPNTLIINPLLENLDTITKGELLFTCFDENCLKKALTKSTLKLTNQSNADGKEFIFVFRDLKASYTSYYLK